MNIRVFSIAVLLALLVGCESVPVNPVDAANSKEHLQFVDLQGFDRNLSASLSVNHPQVVVDFYDQITPSALPVRLQTWMAAVESGGGTVKVVPPKSSVTAKNPLLLMSAISSLWTASKMAKELASKAQFQKVQAYNAEIRLKVDDQGRSMVDQVVFLQKKQ